ncbi:hypothetical protein JCM17823_04850 [Halorubrum gandharaense]
MPGTPDPVLGSDPVTLAVAAILSVLVVSLFAYLVSRSELSAVLLAGVGSAGYGLFTIGVWASVRWGFEHITLDPMADPWPFIMVIVIAGGLLALQAAIPFYLFARFSLVAPMFGFTGISTLLLFVFLRVGGETDPLALFGFGFAPVFIGSLLGLAALETGVRRVRS